MWVEAVLSKEDLALLVAQIALTFVQRFLPAGAATAVSVGAGESAGIPIGTAEGVDAKP